MIGYSIPQPHPIAKRGRPRIEDKGKTLTAKQPWLALGISRRAWYYRKAKDGKII